MLAPGQVFGRYVVEELLGEGGMGQVYRARDTVLHRRVALKILVDRQSDTATWQEAKARMLREARAAAALQHPNAVAIYDVGTEADTPYIAMELVPGQSLRTYVGDAGVPWERKLRWLVDVAAALAAAHDEGLVHRDVKPENVVVRPDGRVKVLDFGIARRAAVSPTAATSGGDTTTTLTGGGIVVGTPRYMSPEQMAGRSVDGRSDQFAWGVTAYEVLSGSNPWPERTDALATAAAILTETPPALLSIAPHLPLAVTQVVDRAISRQADDRLPSMHDIVAALDPFAAALVPAGASSNPLPLAPVSRPRVVDPFAETQAGHETGKAVASDRRGTTMRPRRGKRRLGFVAAALGFAGVAAAGVLLVRARVPSSTPTAPSAAASSAPHALGILDLPRPATKNADALTAYVAGLQALHDSSDGPATERLLAAAKADPSLGAAHLRYALAAYFPVSDAPRKHFNQALALRATMSPYDQALLDAVEPIFDRQPPDWAECERKLDVATKQLPEDAELFGVLAWVREQLGDLHGVMRAADAALAVDPTYAAVMREKAVAAMQSSNWAAAREATDQCIAAVPQASSCVQLRLSEEAWEGRCTDFENDARRIISIDVDGYEGYQKLADASFVLGKPVDTVREALAQEWSRTGRDDKAWFIGTDRVSLAVLLGDAAGVRSAIDQMLKFAGPRSETLYHMIPAWMGVLWETEAGHLDRAAAIAGDYLRRLDAWTADDGLDLFSISYNMRPFMNKALVRAGKLSATDYAKKREEWIDGWKRRLSVTTARYLWIYGYATETDTSDDAREALDALAPYAPIPEFAPSLHATADVGHVFLLGGRLDDAVRWLRSSAQDCDAWENPFEWVKASLWLGEALEQKGDVAGACAAYGRVVERWRPFGKESSSAALAGKRIAALGCGK